MEDWLKPTQNQTEKNEFANGLLLQRSEEVRVHIDNPQYYQQVDSGALLHHNHHQPQRVRNGPRVFSEQEKVDVLCRNCHGGFDEGEDFIAPCSCSGSVKFVHRRCLDTWRMVSQNPDSFYKCDICHTEYQFEQNKKMNSASSVWCSYMKYGFLVTFDISLIVAVWQAIVVTFAVIVHFADVENQRMKRFPNGHVLAVDYLCGLLLFFFLLGVIGLFAGCTYLVYKCCCSNNTSSYSDSDNASYRYNTYPYHSTSYYSSWDSFWFYMFWWNYSFTPYHGPGHVDCCSSVSCSGGDCGDCSNCNCSNFNIDLGNGNDSGGAVAVIGVILLIVAIVMIVIGVFVGIALMTFLVAGILKRRVSIIKKRDEVIGYRVMDLDV